VSANAPSPKQYVGVLIALMALLGLTVLLAFAGLSGKWAIAAAMAVATGKAALILTIFMHLRYAHRLAIAFAAAGFVWLAILLVLTSADYATRGGSPLVRPHAAVSSNP
jgi:cytochrome c oxidase subunit IV